MRESGRDEQTAVVYTCVKNVKKILLMWTFAKSINNTKLWRGGFLLVPAPLILSGFSCCRSYNLRAMADLARSRPH